MSGNNHLIVDENDTRRVTAYFYNQAGTATNPTTTTYAYRKPTQTESAGTTGTPTNSGTGTYYVDVAFDTPGLWFIEMRGTGNGVNQVETYTVDVKRSNVRV